MRRLFLPLVIAALWAAAFVGGSFARCECVRAVARAAAVETDRADHACCHAKSAPAEAAHGHGACGKPGCDHCSLKTGHKAQVWAQLADVPVFFAADLGETVPVPAGAGRAAAVLPRAWAWSLPPPDTLLELRCQLLI